MHFQARPIDMVHRRGPFVRLLQLARLPEKPLLPRLRVFMPVRVLAGFGQRDRLNGGEQHRRDQRFAVRHIVRYRGTDAGGKRRAEQQCRAGLQERSGSH